MSKRPQNEDAIQEMISALPRVSAIEEELSRRQRNRMSTLFPDRGPLRRELYKKQVEFFDAGKDHRERLFLSANRVGKTIAGAYEGTAHATGLYPEWWTGRRFKEPNIGWACNKTATDTRDINQRELLGPPGHHGTGMIPYDLIIQTKSKPAVPDGIEIIYVKHVPTGGTSSIFMKSYDQGREKYQGRTIQWIWADEEVPSEIYTEMLMRTMTTDGMVFCTFTPILGLTSVTVSFLRDSVNKDKLPIKFGGK